MSQLLLIKRPLKLRPRAIESLIRLSNKELMRLTFGVKLPKVELAWTKFLERMKTIQLSQMINLTKNLQQRSLVPRKHQLKRVLRRRPPLPQKRRLQ